MLTLPSLTQHNPYQIWNIGHHRSQLKQITEGNRPAVLVGGASGGIGRAISQAFGQIGWYVGAH